MIVGPISRKTVGLQNQRISFRIPFVSIQSIYGRRFTTNSKGLVDIIEPLDDLTPMQ